MRSYKIFEKMPPENLHSVISGEIAAAFAQTVDTSSAAAAPNLSGNFYVLL